MKKTDRIKAPQQNSGKRVSVLETEDYDAMAIIFSLERLQDGEFCLSGLDQLHKANFAESIFKRRTMSWRELKQTGRHGLGFEKIPRGKIKAGIPRFITDDNDYFLAFRFKGKAPMVGYRLHNIFYVLWFDHKFNLYNHGS